MCVARASAIIHHEQSHPRVPTGERPYKCAAGGKGFPRIQMFTQGEALHAKNMGKAAVRLPTFKYLRVSILERNSSFLTSVEHGKGHSHVFKPTRESILGRNRTNEMCMGRASLEGQHRVLIRVHSGEEPYKCEECNEL